jgi:hypothetical protein
MATPRQARSALGNAIKDNHPPEAVAAARAALKAANLEQGIRAAVSTWPPLTPEQKAELAVLLLTPAAS